MKRFLGHPLFALAIIVLGFLVQLSSRSYVRASFPIDLTISASTRTTDSMRTASIALDKKIVTLSYLKNSAGVSLASIAPSRLFDSICNRLSAIRSTIDLTLPKLRSDAFVLNERISKQNAFIKELAQLQTACDSIACSLPISTPAVGAYTSFFGGRVHPVSGVFKMHTGVDIGAARGSSIRAASAGTVIFAGVKTGYGNTIEIDHGHGYVSLYGHASKLLVKEGDVVCTGDEIALVGSTGVSTGPHLHFEVIVDSVRVDPLPFLMRGATSVTATDNTAIASN